MRTSSIFRVGFLALAFGAALSPVGCGGDDEKSGKNGGDDDAGSGGDSGDGGKGSGGKGSGGKASGGSPGGGAGGRASGGGGGGGGGAPSTAIVINGIARDWDRLDPFSAPVMSGVEVCLHGATPANCVTTGSDGTFSVPDVPADSDVILTMKKEGYLSTARIIRTGQLDITLPAFQGALGTEASTDETLPGVDPDPAKGGIIFFVSVPGTKFQGAFDWLPGYTVTLTPTSGKGPHYLDETHVLDATATAAAGGYGLYTDLAEREYTLKFDVPDGYTCNPWADQIYGYPTDNPLEMRVPVLAGHISYPIGFFCLPDAAPDGGAPEGGTGGSGPDAGSGGAGNPDAGSGGASGDGG